MKPLAPPDSHHLQAAQGWIELGNHLEADKELNEIKPELRDHPDVLKVRWEICDRAKKWDACVEIAQAIVELVPEQAQGWVLRSYALHELKRTADAYNKLLPVGEKFPGVWLIPYNLACYCAQLGRLDESQSWFKKAMAMDAETVKRVAGDDPDLKPLRDSMSATVQKREK